MIPLFKVFMSKQSTINVSDTLLSGYISQGSKVDDFETQLQIYLQTPRILTLNSATSALTLAFRLIDLQDDDEVLCSPLTCFATIAPLLTNYPKVRIRWVDVDPKTANIDLMDLERKVSDKTKAFLFVHWGGSPVDLKEVQRIREFSEDKFNHKIHVIEDCAHSLGAEYQNQKIGSHGNISVFSTQAIKHLTTGDGGFLCLPTDEMYERTKKLRWFGIDRSREGLRIIQNIQEAGYKFHMNDVCASIGLSNLPHINTNIQYTRQLASTYNERFRDINGLQCILPTLNSKSAYWLYTIKIIDRDEFIVYMKNKGIQVSQVHNRIDQYECTSSFKESLPQLDELMKSICCIPIGWWVTQDQSNIIMNAVEEWCQQLHIRPLTSSLEDYESYQHLMYQLNQHQLSIDQTLWETRLAQIETQHGFIYVVEYKETMVATAKMLIEYKFDKNTLHLEDVVVDKDWRHYGIGSMLLKKSIEMAKEYDCYKIILNARREIGQFYKNKGFHYEENEYVYRL